MGRKGDSITLSISDRDKAQLEQLALELEMKWGDRPNISKLVEAIARRQVQVAPNNDWTQERIGMLDRIRNYLVDEGQIELATAIATILSERSELTKPLRRAIDNFLERPPTPWRQILERYIRAQKPFKLIYRDATETSWSFTIRHAAIVTHDRRQYLDCWCEEREGNLDIDELKHNRSLRLDRILEAAITNTAGKWRSQLDKISVTMHLQGSLAFAYKAKTDDSQDEWLPDRPVREVTREISSTFWFYRDILPYGEDCVIMTPDSVCERFIEKLRSLCQNYNIT